MSCVALCDCRSRVVSWKSFNVYSFFCRRPPWNAEENLYYVWKLSDDIYDIYWSGDKVLAVIQLTSHHQFKHTRLHTHARHTRSRGLSTKYCSVLGSVWVRSRVCVCECAVWSGWGTRSTGMSFAAHAHLCAVMWRRRHGCWWCWRRPNSADNNANVAIDGCILKDKCDADVDDDDNNIAPYQR